VSINMTYDLEGVWVLMAGSSEVVVYSISRIKAIYKRPETDYPSVNTVHLQEKITQAIKGCKLGIVYPLNSARDQKPLLSQLPDRLEEVVDYVLFGCKDAKGKSRLRVIKSRTTHLGEI
jgi:hypothetical protein